MSAKISPLPTDSSAPDLVSPPLCNPGIDIPTAMSKIRSKVAETIAMAELSEESLTNGQHRSWSRALDAETALKEIRKEFREKHSQDFEHATIELRPILDLIRKCGDMTLQDTEKAKISTNLEAALEKLTFLQRLPLSWALAKSVKELQLACDIRNEELNVIATYTDGVDWYATEAAGSRTHKKQINVHEKKVDVLAIHRLFEADLLPVKREKETFSIERKNLNQANYLPNELTDFSFHAPTRRGYNYSVDLQRKVQAAFKRAGLRIDGDQSIIDFCGGNPEEITDKSFLNSTYKNKLFMEGPIHIMVAYAKERIDGKYQELMNTLFPTLEGAKDERFKAAPVKKPKRILEKVKADLSQRNRSLFDRIADCYDQDEWNLRAMDLKPSSHRVTLATLCYDINDIVRGALICYGAEDMIRAIELLKSGPSRNGISFKALRIKNTHNAAAETIGGYRDVKIIGVLQVEDKGDAMLVEIQLIDIVFTKIKNFMHKPYSISRGDFGIIPSDEGVIYNGEGAFAYEGREDILLVVVQEGVLEIAEGAFKGCTSLLQVKFANSLRIIGRESFSRTALTEVFFGENIEVIKERAFAESMKLERVQLPDSLETIESRAFDQCLSLKYMNRPKKPPQRRQFAHRPVWSYIM